MFTARCRSTKTGKVVACQLPQFRGPTHHSSGPPPAAAEFKRWAAGSSRSQGMKSMVGLLVLPRLVVARFGGQAGLVPQAEAEKKSGGCLRSLGGEAGYSREALGSFGARGLFFGKPMLASKANRSHGHGSLTIEENRKGCGMPASPVPRPNPSFQRTASGGR